MRPPGLRNPDCGGANDELCTPIWLFQLLDREFRFDVDLFASNQNALCPAWYSQENPWRAEAMPGRSYFANPPYSRAGIKHAMGVVQDVVEEGSNLVVVLHRHEPGARWARFIRARANEVRELDVRLKFRGVSAKTGAAIGSAKNFPCAVSVFRPDMYAPAPHYYVWHVSEWRPRNAK